jgi:hypothetical protein
MLDGLPFVCPWDFTILQTQVTLRSSQRRARPAIANQDFTYSTLWNPVSMVTLVPVTLPCT